MKVISTSCYKLEICKRVSLLGSTGSIGQSTLEVARNLGPGQIRIVAMAAHSNIDLLAAQAREFQPILLAVYDQKKAAELRLRLPSFTILEGMSGVEAVAACSEANFVVSAMTGTLGLQPTIAALRAGKSVGLANKESLVSGGALVMGLAKEKGLDILPIDSEHSALFQCLKGEKVQPSSPSRSDCFRRPFSATTP